MKVAQLISFEKTFEFTLLPEYMKELYPQLTIKEIENAIAVCMQSTKPPRSEADFVACVKMRLMVK